MKLKALVSQYFLITTIIVLILDQLTKHLITSNLELNQTISIIPWFFNLSLTHNYGMAFGILADFSDQLRTILLVVLISLAIFVLLYMLVKEYHTNKLGQLALGLIMGGALGNIIDRIFYGYVIDFLDFFYLQYHWPAFNLADSTICIGVGVLLLTSIKRGA